MKINLIVIDDDVTLKNNPLFVVIGEELPETTVVFFEDTNEAIRFINERMILPEKIIILLDLTFSNNSLTGISVLKEIRNRSWLIPVIIFTASDEDLRVAQDLINFKATAFIKKSLPYSEKLEIIRKTIDLLNTDIASAVDEWIVSNPAERRDIPFVITSEGNTFTLNEILEEVRKETSMGKEFTNNLLKLTIDLVARNKEKLSD